MNKTFYLLAFVAVFAAGCSDKGYKKSLNGLEYKIMKGNGGQPIKTGNTVKFTIIGYYKDSTLVTGYDSIPQLLAIDSNNLPPAYLKIFTEARTGDSIVTRILVDSLMKQNPQQQLPPFAKKGQYFSTHIRIMDVFTDTAVINREKTASMNTATRVDSLKRTEQKMKDDKTLSDYITKEHLTTVKTAMGTYVTIENPGQGVSIDSGKAVTVNYTGMTLDGKVFDKTYDSSGKPTKPYTFVIGQHQAIEGWDDGMRLFKKGGKGKLFIPSSLAYGPRGNAGIKPNESLLFQIDVVNVTSGEDYHKQMEAQNKAMQQLQNMQQQRKGQQQPQQQTQPAK
jgi:FKBP-type peptidyl-prolyl cis-trans isomerase FkpA